MSNWGEFPRSWANFTSGKYAKLLTLIPDGPRLPSGEWRMIANGRIWQLDVIDGQIDPKSGPGSTGDPLLNVNTEWLHGARGTSLCVSFRRRVAGPDPDVIQEWVGYMMTSPLDTDGELIDDKYRIAGTFEQIEKFGQNNMGSWYATIDRADAKH